MGKRKINIEDTPQILGRLMEMLMDLDIKVQDIYNKVNETPRRPLTIELAGDIICKGKSTIYKLVAANEIPFHKKGRRLYFFEDELLEWIEKTKPVDYKSRTDGHLKKYSTLLSHKRKQ